MEHIVENMFGSFAHLAIQNSILVLIVYLLTHSAKGLSAWLRQLIWIFTFAGVLFMPLLNEVVPTLYHGLDLSVIDQAVRLENKPEAAKPEVFQPDETIVAADKLTQLTQQGPAAKAGHPKSAPATIASQPSPPTFDEKNGANFLLIIFAIWVSGALLLLLRMLLSRLFLFVIAQKSHQIIDGRWVTLANKLRIDSEVGRSIKLLASPRINSPVTWGTIWPKILLPAHAQQWSAAHKKYVLLHELAHIKRYDDFTQMAVQFVCFLNWYNPFIWLAFRQYARERERACDEFVLRGINRPSDYASFLLDVARGIRKYPVFAFSMLYMARKSELEGRLLNILNSKSAHRKIRYITGLISFFSVLLIISVSSLHPQGKTLDQTSRYVEKDRSVNIEIISRENELALAPEQDSLQEQPQSQNGSTLLSSLNRAVNDSSKSVRMEAVKTLGKIGQPEAVTILLSALNDPSDDIREKTLEVLAEIMDPRIIPALKGALNDPDSDVREKAVESLGNRKDSSLASSIIPLLQDKDEDVRKEAAESLGELENSAAMPPLRSRLSDESWEVQREAIKALGKLGDSQSLASIADKLSDDRWRLRQVAAWALGSIKSPQAINYLATAINDKNEKVRREIARALGKIGSDEGIFSLKRMFSDEKSRVREEAAKALLEINSTQSIAELENMFQSSSNNLKEDILEALEDAQSRKGIEILRRALADPSSKIRRKAVETLRNYDKSYAIPLLEEALKDRSDSVRKEAAESLGEMFD